MLNKSKNVKRFISISAAAVCILSSLRIAPLGDFADAADTMTAFEITKNMRVGWNLGNTLDAKATDAFGAELESAGLETETCWGCPKANQTLFDSLKAKGFNTVRIPTTWFQHLDGENNIDPEWMARVHEVVDYAIKNDMYVILNLHHENWVNRSDIGTAYDQMKPKLLKIWEQINKEFSDYDQHLIFECMNEPRAVGTAHEWWGPEKSECDTINKLNADFVNLIRSSDSKYAKTRLLMLPGYCAAADVSMISKIVVPDDEYCAVSIHAYVPYNFTMNTNEKEGAYHDTFTLAFQNDLRNTLDGIRQTFLDKDIPVIIGEMGTSNFGNTQARVDWTTQYFTTAKKYGIPCCLWDNNTVSNPKDPGECHGYVNRETGVWHEGSLPIINKMMEILGDESIKWGSERKLPEYTHQDLASGTVFRSEAVEIDASKSKTYENTTPGQEVAWSDLKGKEVAIQYTGATPILAFSDAEYGNWTEIKPYSFDEANGIAYYLVDQVLPQAWGEDKLDSVNHMQARTDDVTMIQKIVILEAPDVTIDVPVDNTKKYKLDFKDADRTANLQVTIKGEPNTDTNGAVGYNGDGWEQIEWSGKTNANGVLVVEIPMSKIPSSVASAEFQIWYQAEAVDMEGYKFASAAVTTTTTTTATTTTTTTTTTKPVPGVVAGDANLDGGIDMSDVVIIMQALANPNKYVLSAEAAANADVYENNGVTAQDALAIQYFLLGRIASLPVPSGVTVK